MTNPLTTLHDPEVIGLILNYRDATRTVRCIASLLDDGISHILVWDNSGDDGASANTLQSVWYTNRESASKQQVSISDLPLALIADWPGFAKIFQKHGSC